MAGRATTPQSRKLGNSNNMPNRRYLPSINFSVPFARWSHFYVSIDWTILFYCLLSLQGQCCTNNKNNHSCNICNYLFKFLILGVLLLLLLLFGQVDQQDVPIIGQPSKKQSKNKKKKKQNDQTTKQSLKINRTIPTHTKQLASYCRSLMRGLK
jgi:hypothetical protein